MTFLQVYNCPTHTNETDNKYDLIYSIAVNNISHQLQMSAHSNLQSLTNTSCYFDLQYANSQLTTS